MNRSSAILTPFPAFYSTQYCEKCNSLRVESMSVPYLEQDIAHWLGITNQLSNVGLGPLLSDKIAVHNEYFFNTKS